MTKAFKNFYNTINARPLAAFSIISFVFIALTVAAGFKFAALWATAALLIAVFGYAKKRISAPLALIMCAAIF